MAPRAASSGSWDENSTCSTRVLDGDITVRWSMKLVSSRSPTGWSAAHQPEQDQRPRQKAQASGRRIEFGVALKMESLDRLAREIARGENLDLAVDRQFVERVARFRARPLRPGAGEIALLILDQDAGFGDIARFDQSHEQDRRRQRAQHDAQDEALPAPQRGRDAAEVDLVPAVIQLEVAVPRVHSLLPQRRDFRPFMVEAMLIPRRRPLISRPCRFSIHAGRLPHRPVVSGRARTSRPGGDG